MVKRKNIIWLILIIIAVVIITYLKERAPLTPTTDRHVTILLDWYISQDQAPVLIADINGYFKQNNLDVKIVELSDPSIAPKLIANNQADLAISYGGSYQHQLQAGIAVKQVGTLVDRPLNCLIYFSQSGIHSPQDLKGKRVGFTDPNDDFLLLKAVLKSGGLTMNDVTLINIQSTLLQSLMLGKVDIATDMMRNIEPVVFAHHGFTSEMFCPENFNVPNYPELIYITHTGQTPDKINAFLQAVTEATRYIEQHPEEAWGKLKTTYPKFDTDIHHEIWQKTYPFFAHDPKKIESKRI
ncbi:MAG: ABC transporter substrate-binding protein [Pseudomonadota bacterium]